MTNIKSLLLGLACVAGSTIQVFAQTDSTGMPGDNFSLQGALEMFKQSGSPEEFEKKINEKDNNVNNLDLNDDGETDYIQVIGKTDNNVHAFILRVAISETENQDIAVIELEKNGDKSAIIQIIGDEEIYGEAVIAEPSEEGDEVLDDNNKTGNGPSADFYDPERIVVNVFLWPCVQFSFRPAYIPWVSPWRWGHYPNWWKPWRPLRWHVFHPRRLHFHRHFAVVHTHRVLHAHRVYTPHRTSSVIVRNRTVVVRNNYRTNRSSRQFINRQKVNSQNNNNGNREGKEKKEKIRENRKGRKG